MDQIVHNVRQEYWRDIVAQCQSRPEGMTAKQWMHENGINDKSYYYWQRKFRIETFQELVEEPELPVKISSPANVSFAEMPYPTTGQAASTTTDANQITPVGVIRSGNMSVAFTENIPPQLLSLLVKEAANA